MRLRPSTIQNPEKSIFFIQDKGVFHSPVNGCFHFLRNTEKARRYVRVRKLVS